MLRHKPPNSHILVHVLLLLAIIFVATSFPVGAIITNNLPPAILMFCRFTVAAVLFLPYVAIKHGFKIPTKYTLARYACLSTPLVGFFWCMFESLRYTSVINTGALYTLVPAFTAVAAYFINRETSTRLKKIGLLIGTVGALWIVFRGDLNLVLSMHLNYGDWVFIIGCIALSIYMPLVKRLHAGEPMEVLTFWVLAFGSLWLLLLSLPRILQIEWGNIGLNVYLGTIYLALFSTLLTFLINHYGTLKIGATKVAAYSFLTPFFVIVISLIIGLAKFDIVFLPGLILILLSIGLIQIEPHNKSIKTTNHGDHLI